MSDDPIVSFACHTCGELLEPALELYLSVTADLQNAERELRAKRAKIKRLQNEQDEQTRAHPRAADAMDVLEFWRETCAPQAVELGGKRLENCIARLKAGYSVEQLKLSVSGYAAFPYVVNFNRSAHGTPDNRRVDAEFIFREPRRVDDGINLARRAERLRSVPIEEPAQGRDIDVPSLGALGASACKLAEFGWYVFPIKPREKAPATLHGLNDATLDVGKIAAFWSQRPDHNVGVRCGRESGIVVLDVDDRHGGAESLAELEDEHGVIPKTLSVATPSGGQHYYFQHPGGEIRNTAGFPAPGLDIRGDGGYVLAPPSVNAEGRAYEVDDQVPLAPMPAWLVQKLLARREALSKMGPQEWVDAIMRNIPEGGRNNALAQITGKYLSEGLSAELVLSTVWGQNLAYCKPPLDGREVKSIVESIIRRNDRRQNEAVAASYREAA